MERNEVAGQYYQPLRYALHSVHATVFFLSYHDALGGSFPMGGRIMTYIPTEGDGGKEETEERHEVTR